VNPAEGGGAAVWWLRGRRSGKERALRKEAGGTFVNDQTQVTSPSGSIVKSPCARWHVPLMRCEAGRSAVEFVRSRLPCNCTGYACVMKRVQNHSHRQEA